jgi:hypothetical protein
MARRAQRYEVLDGIAASQRAEFDVMEVERVVLLRIVVNVHQPKPHSPVNTATPLASDRS